MTEERKLNSYFCRAMLSLAYNNGLTVLGLERLEMRRLKVDLLTCFKIVHNYVDVDRTLF